MRFGRSLHEHYIPEWASSYLDYYSLKRCIKLAIRDALAQPDHVDLTVFATILDVEVATVEGFYLRQRTNLDKQRDSLLRRYPHESCRTRDFLTRIQRTHEFKLKGFKGNILGAHIHDSFTTLEELLRSLPDEVAMDIELKYPMLWEAEDWKTDLYGVEFNLYLDTILGQIYKHAGNRSILFTSFSPELCILAAHKQDTYPVMFLNESNLFPTGDVRASNLQEAIHFARHWALPGVVMSSEPFFASPKLIKFVQDDGLKCLSFGMLNNDTEKATIQVEAGLDALIVDSVALINDSFKKRVRVTSARPDDDTTAGASRSTS